MDNRNTGEDELDTEALQAQIDLSMSFAQNLVSSWVKPSRKLPQRNRDVEAELKEYMRRPPRLGVGVPISETRSFSRETARLKGQLIGKSTKRSRNDEEDAKIDRADTIDDDNDESRAGAIKKKVRLDPFGDGYGKKKKKKQVAPNSNPGSASAPDASQLNDTEKSEQAEVIGIITEVDAAESSSSQPSKLSALQSTDGASASPTKPMSNSTYSANRPEKFRVRDPAPQLPLQVVDVSLVTLRSRRSLLSQPAILQQPVLNLNPLSSDDQSDPEAELEASSPKKKRKKRRKRKKKHQSADVTIAAQAKGDI